MRITDLLDVRSIALNVHVSTKEETIDQLVDLMYEAQKIDDKEVYKKGIWEREALSTTGIGEGIAIPHAQVSAVKKAGLAAMTIQNGVDYHSLDGQPVYLCFMIAAPEDGGDVHLQALAKLSVLLMNEEFRKSLINANSAEEFLHIIDHEETAKDAMKKTDDTSKQYRVLAVTACPTGIAHTFMAAENLTKAGESMGYLLKAETNGADGAKNVLTDQEIIDCEGLLLRLTKMLKWHVLMENQFYLSVLHKVFKNLKN